MKKVKKDNKEDNKEVISKSGKIAYYLLTNHSIGGFRNEADINNAKYHALVSLTFLEDFLVMDGSIEDKLNWIKEAKDVELHKFNKK